MSSPRHSQSERKPLQNLSSQNKNFFQHAVLNTSQPVHERHKKSNASYMLPQLKMDLPITSMAGPLEDEYCPPFENQYHNMKSAPCIKNKKVKKTLLHIHLLLNSSPSAPLLIH